MASGNATISAVPATCTHGPKKRSVNAQTYARGSRRRLRVLTAVSRLLTTSSPSASTATVTGESCGEPSDRVVASTARWWARRKSSAAGMSMRSWCRVRPWEASGVLALGVLEPEEGALPAVRPLLLVQEVEAALVE